MIRILLFAAMLAAVLFAVLRFIRRFGVEVVLHDKQLEKKSGHKN